MGWIPGPEERLGAFPKERFEMEARYPCPCCGFLTMAEPAGSFAICPVCGWEDDYLQYHNPSYDGGANGISLSEARENYRSLGPSSKRRVRAPLPEEYPPK